MGKQDPKFLIRYCRVFLEAEVVDGEGSSKKLKSTVIEIDPRQLVHFGSELHKSNAGISQASDVYSIISDSYFLKAIEKAQRADADYVFVSDPIRRDEVGYSWLEGNLTLYLKKH